MNVITQPCFYSSRVSVLLKQPYASLVLHSCSVLARLQNAVVHILVFMLLKTLA